MGDAMTIADTLIKNILADHPLRSRDMDPVPPDSAPLDDLLDPDFFLDGPDIEVFLDRAPDSGEDFPEEPGPWSVLGTYHHMASPGLITLYRRNIEAYWMSLLRHARRQFPFITHQDAERMLRLVTHSVYQHERFHYLCDFSRQLLGGQFDHWHEEGLAVAHEWHWQKGQAWNSDSGRMHPSLRRIVMHTMFNHRGRGYRDWRQYAVLADFHAAVTAYLGSHVSPTLAGTAFNLGAWLVAHGADEGNKGWEERIL